MKTVMQYREDIKALMKKAADVDAACVAENRDPVEAELTFQNEIMDTVKEYQTIIQTKERRDKMQATLEQPEDRLTKPAPENKGHSITIKDKEKFSSFGEQMMAVMTAGRPGGHADPRLFNASGLNETTPSDGGFLVQNDFSTEMLHEVLETGILASRCKRMQISGNSNSIKINGVDETSRASTRYGGIVGYWKDEAQAATASKPKFRQIELNLKKLVGLCYATDELLDDASALESVIRSGFVSEFGFLLDDAIINGTGAGQPLGILNSGCVVSVEKATGQAKETVIFENIIAMYSRLFAASRPNAVWLINQNVEPQLFSMTLSAGTSGVPVYMPAGGISGQPYGTLFGLPVLPIEQAATLGTQGDVILADLTNGYILAEKGGIKSDMSIHVQFIYDESVFRFVLRIDGQPVRATALTPYKGGSGSTQSHFITLDTRA